MKTSLLSPNTKPFMISKNIPYYLIAIALFIVLKFGYTFADNNDLLFLLKPINQFVGLLSGSSSVYFLQTGYYHEKLHILIDKSCSGFNFWILGFLIFSYLGIKYSERIFQKLLAIPLALLGAYLLTIFVNSSRIFASIIVQHHTQNIFINQQYIVHEAIGVITNLSFLILAYVLCEKFLIHKRHNAKLT